MRQLSYYLLVFCTLACSQEVKEKEEGLSSIFGDAKRIAGNEDYVQSPYVTAGDRVYAVGHQDGSFPDLGWHVEGEMGGIWDHPIKLMDGFQANVIIDGDTFCLSKAKQFINYPFGNKFTYEIGELQIARLQFVPDGQEGMIIEFEFANDGESKEVGFGFTGMIDLSPVWLAEEKGITDGQDEARYNSDYEAFIAKDQQNEWFVMFGADLRPEYYGVGSMVCKSDNQGKGTNGSLSYSLSLSAGETKRIKVFVAGSYTSLDAVKKNFETIKADPHTLVELKKGRYEETRNRTNLEVNDGDFSTVFEWIKYNTDWLIRDVPEEGRALSAGIPDYPWWFGADNAYSLQGMLATGMHEEVMSTIDLVMKLSHRANGENGRIMHEASTNGVVFNPGNLNETPHFIYMLWKAYEWTGDQKIIDNYYEDVIRGIEWIEGEDKDGNGYPDGPGMMEIHGLHTEMIDVAAYMAGSYFAAANFAKAKGDEKLYEEYYTKYKELVVQVNNQWWNEEFESYADFRATKEQAIELIEAAIVRADTINKPWSREELEKTLTKVKTQNNQGLEGYVVHHNWVVNTPMEMGIADEDKAIKALKTARKYTNRFGMYVTGMDRDEQQEKAEKWKAFSYVGAVMTLPTGVQAVSEINYGNPDAALEYLKMLENSFSYALPGSMYEVSPDYGMIAQAWNIYAVAYPVVEGFFGIKPKAYEKKITVSPKMPSKWEEAKLSNVRIGDNEITIEKNGDTYQISQKLDWEIRFISNDQEVIFKDREKTITIEN